LKELGARVFRDGLVTHLTVGFEDAMGPSAPRMNDSLRNPFPIKVRDLLKEVIVFERDRAT
jgi:hypothetical protein